MASTAERPTCCRQEIQAMIFKILINQREHNLKLHQKDMVISGLSLLYSVLLFLSQSKDGRFQMFPVLKSLCIFSLMSILWSYLEFKALKMSSGKAGDLTCRFFRKTKNRKYNFILSHNLRLFLYHISRQKYHCSCLLLSV